MLKNLISFIIQKLYPRETKILIHKINKITLNVAFEEFKDLITILVISEDRRFWQHCGFDYKAIIRAVYNYIIYNKKSGASTITQQLVRTITNYRENTLKRKIKEILLAIYIEREFDKKTIAMSYLFLGYYGWRMNGIIEAMDRLHTENIFEKVDLPYAIISMLKYPLPQHYSPKRLNEIYARILYIKYNEKI